MLEHYIFVEKGFVRVNSQIKYLCVPYIQNARYTKLMNSLHDKLVLRMGFWTIKPVFQAWKICNDQVLLDLPIYIMLCYKLPQYIIHKLHSTIERFCHSRPLDSNHKLSWESYDKLSQTKYEGGFGIQNLKLFNQALLAKNAWDWQWVLQVYGHKFYMLNTSLIQAFSLP